MAAITLTRPTREKGSAWTVRSGTAQADTGQTDWIATPSDAKSATVYVNLVAVAGTLPQFDLKLKEADPVVLDDGKAVDLADWNGITQLTAAGFVVVKIGPGITGIADDDTASTYHLNEPLPSVLGLTATLGRTNSNETYTYTLKVVWNFN